MLLLSLLVFAAVSLGLVGLYLILVPSRAAQRLHQFTGAGAGMVAPGWTESIARVVGPFARLSTPDGDWENSPLRLKFMQAGIRDANARLVYFGAKTLLPLLLGFFAYFVLRGFTEIQGLKMLFWIMLAAAFGCYLPNFALWLAVRERKREIFESFPDAADLMLVCVEAGLGLDAAMNRVADEMRRKSTAMAEELQLTNLELRAGGSRAQALRNLAQRTGVDEVLTFATMITQADKFGTSIADSLRVFSEDLRHKRQTRAEEKAAKIPTKMLFPLVLFIFPSIIMVVLGPAIIRMIRVLLPMIGGA